MAPAAQGPSSACAGAFFSPHPYFRPRFVGAGVIELAHFSFPPLRRYATRTWRALLSPPPLRVVLYVLALEAPLILATLGALCHKLFVFGAFVSPLPATAILLNQVALAAMIFAISTLLLARGGRFRGAIAVFLHVFSALALFGIALHHGFFISTGAILDWPIIAYTWKHFAMLRPVMASEVRIPTVIAFLGVCLLPFLPIALPQTRRWWRDDGLALAHKWPYWLGCSAIVVGANLAVSLASLPDKLRPLLHNPQFSLLSGAFHAMADKESDEQAVDAHASPVQPFVVTKTSQTKDYNVVLIVLESTRAVSTTAYNPTLPTMPFLKQLADKGARVLRAYTTVPHTTKSLVPTHCGIYPKISPQYQEVSGDGLPTDCLAKILQQHGWSTAYFMSCDAEFELNRDLVRQFGFANLVSKENLTQGKFDVVNYFGYEDKILIDPVMKWVDNQRAQPFFLSFLTTTSHHPYGLPKNFVKRRFVADEKANDYLNTLKYTDEFIEQLYTGLQKRGLLDKTVFVLIGDHGEGFGEHGLYQHDEIPYEEGLHVPLVVLGPGIKPQQIDGLRQNIDVLPTVLDALGLAVIAGELPGTSVLSSAGHPLLNLATWPKEHALMQLQGQQKTIFNYERRGVEVYDLATDSSETFNLVEKGEVKKSEIDKRVAQMQAWKTAANAQYANQGKRRKFLFVSKNRPKMQHTVDLMFGDSVHCIGYDLETDKVKAGEASWLTLHFEVLKQPPKEWEMFMHVNGPNKHFIRFDHVPVEGDYPVAQWNIGEFVSDRTRVAFRDDVPSGQFELTFGFYSSKDNKRAAASGKGLIIDRDNRLLAATFTVTNPNKPYVKPIVGKMSLSKELRLKVLDAPPTGAKARTVDFASAKAQPAVRLVGVDAPDRPVSPGEEVSIRLVFQVLKPLPRYTDSFVHILGPKGRFHNASKQPLGGAYLPDEWQVGEFIDDTQTFTLPEDWPLGPSQVMLGFWNVNLDLPFQRLYVSGAGSKVDAESRAEILQLNVALPTWYQWLDLADVASATAK